MRQSLSKGQRRVVELAGELADRFAERAERHDRDNTFPVENYADMRDAGFLRLTLPEELGGYGAGQAELLPALERLAMGDASTALAVTMHLSPLAQWSAVWRRTGSPALEGFLRKAAADELVWASVTSEIGSPNLMTDAQTKATRVEGGYRIDGRKSFGTNTAVATHCSTTARYDDPERGSRLMLMRIDLGTPGVQIHQTWDTLGMRATQSNDVEFTDHFVADSDIVYSLPVGHLDSRILETVFGWAMPAFGAVYIGVARGALEWAVQQCVRRGRGTDPRVQDVVAECEIQLETARAVLDRHSAEVASGRLLEDFTVQEGLARCALVKYVCSNNATAIVDRLVEVVGGAGYIRRLPFERMWRDVQAGRVMPFANHAARELIGATTLGVQLAPVAVRQGDESVRPQDNADEESDHE